MDSPEALNTLYTSQRADDLAAALQSGMYVGVTGASLCSSSRMAQHGLLLAQIVATHPHRTQVDVTIWSGQTQPAAQAPVYTVSSDAVHRVRLAKGTPYRHRASGEVGRVIFPCNLGETSGVHREYFVDNGHHIRVVSERELAIAAEWYAPDCLHHLQSYTLSRPQDTWERTDLLTQVAQINAATDGIAELLGARVKLLVHQAEVVQRVLNSSTCRFMLADEVGLGKTIEAGLILQGLRRGAQVGRVLVAAPAALIQQWKREMHAKFRLELGILSADNFAFATGRPRSAADGMLVAYEELSRSPTIQRHVQANAWDLLILDEVHNLRRTPPLYDFLHTLSAGAARVLVLTATPVEHRAEEYLYLLRVLDPAHYDRVGVQEFTAMVGANKELRSTIAYLERGLADPAEFSVCEFQTELSQIMQQLPDDPRLSQLFGAVDHKEVDRAIANARATLAYLRENYRIDSRVFRNRRAALQKTGLPLPTRVLDLTYTYTPANFEQKTLRALHDYAEACLESALPTARPVDVLCTFFHAAASSAETLLALVRVRAARLRGDVGADDLLSPATLQKINDLSPFADESRLLGRIEQWAQVWREQTHKDLRNAAARRWPKESSNRLLQVLRCARDYMNKGQKLLIFSSWGPTLDILFQALTHRAGPNAVAEFHRRLDRATLDSEADWFQNEEKCQLLLLDETGGEGRNFQVADAIIHVDLPWTPALLEQRIGRVDRIGRRGEVTSIAPLALGTVEEALYRLWQEGFKLFTESMSGMEIVLEDVQREVADTFAVDTRQGLQRLLPGMIHRAAELRDEVDEERYWDEGRIDWRRRRIFEEFSERYGDGAWLRAPVQRALQTAGYRTALRPATNIVLAAKPSYRLDEIPDFPTERRSNSQETRDIIRGTLDRTTAVAHESIRFFALGDPLVDQITEQATHSPARAAAILRRVHGLTANLAFLAFTYRAVLDPRPCLVRGYTAHHLLRLYTYLPTLIRTVYLALPDMTVLDHKTPSHDRYLRVLAAAPNDDDTDLGSVDQIARLKRMRQPSEWSALIERGQQRAEAYLQHTCVPSAQELETARAELWAGIESEQATRRWLVGHDTDAAHIAQAERLANLLLTSLEQPLWLPESAVFWYLQGRKRE
ncbi:MAG: DEAD/DEAH box helicase family protein [Caldilineaceae bacterium]|nr:DEAD/DEAH box helicase family protein [Caldilineaceae bacterium]